MQSRKSATPRTAGGNQQNPEVWDTCPMVKSVAVMIRWTGREAALTMDSSTKPFRKGFVPMASARVISLTHR